MPQYLSSVDPDAPPTPVSIVYRNYAITSIVGCPGSILACYTVDIKYIGRKGTMAVAALLTGIFICLFTASSDADYQLAFSCLVAFFQNIMYGVLYAYTPGMFTVGDFVALLICLRNLPCTKSRNRNGNCVFLQPHCWSLCPDRRHSWLNCRSEDSNLCLWSSFAFGLHCDGVSSD